MSATDSLRTVCDDSSEYHFINTRQLHVNQFTILKLLNRGQRGKIYLVHDNVANFSRVLRIIPKVWTSASAAAVREQEVLKYLVNLHLPHIAPLRGSWYDESYLYLLMDYYHGSDMAFEILRSKQFTEERAKFYIAQLVLALDSLHESGIIYRNVAPHNILLDRDGYIVFSSFSSAKLFYQHDDDDGIIIVANDIVGIPHYMAPEAHMGSNYSYEIDFWGMGVVLYQMITGRLPFGHDLRGRDPALSARIRNEPVMFEPMDQVSDTAKQFIRQLLEKDPTKRLPPHQIRKHAFFSDIDWNKLKRREITAPWKPRVSSSLSSSATQKPLVLPEDKFKIQDFTPLPSFIYYPPADEPGTEESSKDESSGNSSIPAKRKTIATHHSHTSVDACSDSAAHWRTGSTSSEIGSTISNGRSSRSSASKTVLPLCFIWKLLSLMLPHQVQHHREISTGGSAGKASISTAARSTHSPIISRQASILPQNTSDVHPMHAIHDCNGVSNNGANGNRSGNKLSKHKRQDSTSSADSGVLVTVHTESRTSPPCSFPHRTRGDDESSQYTAITLESDRGTIRSDTALIAGCPARHDTTAGGSGQPPTLGFLARVVGWFGGFWNRAQPTPVEIPHNCLAMV